MSSLLVVAVLATACSGGAEKPPAKPGAAQAEAVAAPVKDGAAPGEVVGAYLKAINAHDRKAGQALTTGYFAELQKQVVRQDDIFKDARLAGIKIDAPVVERGYKSPDGHRYADAVNVPVSFDLQHAHLQSMPDGPTDWGYLLVRTAPGKPWRINDQGVG
ncbi:DUF4829 domain-containing protein [Actinomadura macrotermitis]|uniref:DUF4829 domain-containing protein n=1 Tax=Actinomadura macrotermitis TaxID=2585200 RepID=UPI002E252A47